MFIEPIDKSLCNKYYVARKYALEMRQTNCEFMLCLACKYFDLSLSKINLVLLHLVLQVLCDQYNNLPWISYLSEFDMVDKLIYI